jgi:hypothetical protein
MASPGYYAKTRQPASYLTYEYEYEYESNSFTIYSRRVTIEVDITQPPTNIEIGLEIQHL